jgi:hypothetical protein
LQAVYFIFIFCSDSASSFTEENLSVTFRCDLINFDVRSQQEVPIHLIIANQQEFCPSLRFNVQLAQKAVLWIRIRRICMFLGLPDKDPSLFVWIRILPSTSKTIRINLDFYYFVTSFLLFVFED